MFACFHIFIPTVFKWALSFCCLFVVYSDSVPQLHNLQATEGHDDNNNNYFIYKASLKTMFTKCFTESQGKTNGIVRNKYNI